MKVTICMLTYNHEHYLAQAIESVLMQEVDFDFELVISEDFSTDQTLKIAQEYAARYPNTIRVVSHKTNVGMVPNFLSVFNAYTAEYFAILDGDDFWMSPYKLQAQVDFLDSHPDYTLCITRAVCVLAETNTIVRYLPFTDRDVFTFKDLIKYDQFAVSSTMYRRNLIGKLPEDEYVQLTLPDWPLHLLFLNHGPGACLPEVMTGYRQHRKSVSSNMSNVVLIEGALDVLDFVQRHVGHHRRPIIIEARLKIYLGTALRFGLKGNIRLAATYVKRGLSSVPVSMWFSFFPLRIVGSAAAFVVRRIVGRISKSSTSLTGAERA